MVSVIVLGSGTPNPDPDRAGSAVAVVDVGIDHGVDGDDWVLIDCGRGATVRAITAGLDLTRLVAVFLTHHHSDHISDVPTLAIARWVAGGTTPTTPLVVVAPAGPACTFAVHCLDAFDDDCFHRQAPREAGPRPQIEVRAFEPTGEVTTVHDLDGWVVGTTLVDHHPIEPAVAYRVERRGSIAMVSGDTRVCDGVRALAVGAHVIVHEALLGDRVPPTVLEWNASAESVGALAAWACPQALVLTHLIPAPTCADDERAYTDDVRRGGFDGRTLVARDLVRVEIDVGRS